MKAQINAFLDDLDAFLLTEAPGAKLKVYHIGRSALVWKYNSTVTTMDFDVFHSKGDDNLIKTAEQVFGHGTDKARQHGLYLQIVNDALPPALGGYANRASQADGPWTILQIFHLEPHDLAATKMRRFAARDREDIRFLCDLELLDSDELEDRLQKAFPFVHEKDGDEYRDSTFRNLRIVQQYLNGKINEF
jgi:hypothetical protein